MTIEDIIERIKHSENIELYLTMFVMIITLWLVWNTVKYYINERRKMKQLNRFSRSGTFLSQYALAKRYAKRQSMRKSASAKRG